MLGSERELFEVLGSCNLGSPHLLSLVRTHVDYCLLSSSLRGSHLALLIPESNMITNISLLGTYLVRKIFVLSVNETSPFSCLLRSQAYCISPA